MDGFTGIGCGAGAKSCSLSTRWRHCHLAQKSPGGPLGCPPRGGPILAVLHRVVPGDITRAGRAHRLRITPLLHRRDHHPVFHLDLPELHVVEQQHQPGVGRNGSGVIPDGLRQPCRDAGSGLMFLGGTELHRLSLFQASSCRLHSHPDARGVDMSKIIVAGHGGPGPVASTYLDAPYIEICMALTKSNERIDPRSLH